MDVKDNLQHIMKRIEQSCEKVNRKSTEVKIIGVTKYVSIPRASEALAAGVIHLGENRVEEGLEKREALGDKAIWHFIGNLQSKKVKQMIDQFDYLHSLDRLSLAKEINKRAPHGTSIKCFVQINVSGEESKSGINPSDAIQFVTSLKQFEAIEVVGLMTMAPFVENKEETRPVFRKLKELKDTIEALQLPHAPCHELSMGMSNDYEVAVEEGATFIRIGSSLVGNES
ncbi:YggS family pyridoxal phosphate-dependent enzyme [Evansella sp. AB-rgal1]|uniref:YggS family pyridoxal phosphate-dependent enzyme n=1 Tax=Evansella sp. AB-rgal1 TaxID=3242696 RepID=UPI00359DF63A